MPIKIEKSAKLQRLLYILIYTLILQIACLRHIHRLCDPQKYPCSGTLPIKASHTSVHFLSVFQVHSVVSPLPNVMYLQIIVVYGLALLMLKVSLIIRFYNTRWIYSIFYFFLMWYCCDKQMGRLHCRMVTDICFH